MNHYKRIVGYFESIGLTEDDIQNIEFNNNKFLDEQVGLTMNARIPFHIVTKLIEDTLRDDLLNVNLTADERDFLENKEYVLKQLMEIKQFVKDRLLDEDSIEDTKQQLNFYGFKNVEDLSYFRIFYTDEHDRFSKQSVKVEFPFIGLLDRISETKNYKEILNFVCIYLANLFYEIYIQIYTEITNEDIARLKRFEEQLTNELEDELFTNNLSKQRIINEIIMTARSSSHNHSKNKV